MCVCNVCYNACKVCAELMAEAHKFVIVCVCVCVRAWESESEIEFPIRGFVAYLFVNIKRVSWEKTIE